METSKEKLAIIGTVGVPARYGGFETLAHQLVEQLADSYEITVYCSGKQYIKGERPKHWKGAKLSYLPISANGISSILYDSLSIIHALFFSQILLVLGVSAGIFFPIFKLFSSKAIIVNIDGLEWRRGKWSSLVKRYLRFAERVAVTYADAVVADNRAIASYVADTYGIDALIIPYGGDHVQKVTPTAFDHKLYPCLLNNYAFKVCRIEPENNIHMILDAFIEFEAYPLVLVGNWQASNYGQDLWEKYHNHPNLILLNPIYETRELNLLRSNCCIYVHGHSAGGTNPSLVEAMSLGLPTIAFDVIYNKYTTDFQAFFFENKNDLIKKLKALTFGDLVANGINMKALADTHYTWKNIASYYQQSFELVKGTCKHANLAPKAPFSFSNAY